MGKTRKSAEPEESVLRDAKEETALEQYRHLADRPKPRKPPKNYKYLDELAHLQFELIKLQEWVRVQGLRVVIIFEGRDAAGKGGVIKRITESLNPRICRVVALGTPTERERGQWYYQRYVAHLPAPGEIVLFDRSWYNRAGVEHVMGFCTMEGYRRGVKTSTQDARSLRWWLACGQANLSLRPQSESIAGRPRLCRCCRRCTGGRPKRATRRQHPFTPALVCGGETGVPGKVARKSVIAPSVSAGALHRVQNGPVPAAVAP